MVLTGGTDREWPALALFEAAQHAVTELGQHGCAFAEIGAHVRRVVGVRSERQDRFDAPRPRPVEVNGQEIPRGERLADLQFHALHVDIDAGPRVQQ